MSIWKIKTWRPRLKTFPPNRVADFKMGFFADYVIYFVSMPAVLTGTTSFCFYFVIKILIIPYHYLFQSKMLSVPLRSGKLVGNHSRPAYHTRVAAGCSD